MNDFLTAVKNRRSYYNITNEAIISNEKLKELIELAVEHSPSAFNSQSSRAVLLLGEEHKKLWDIALNKLKPLVSEENFVNTKQKIESFAAGYGTVLYYEEQTTVRALQDNFPLYSDNFPTWSEHASAILQFVIWTALEAEGFGASLQHYNPLIDVEVAKTWDIPGDWKLIAQMPFGKPAGPAGDKSFLPIDTKVKVFG